MEVNGFNINPQSGEAGANEISISISAVNEGIDKAVEINAVSGDKTAKMTLIHEGMREVFEPSDGGFILADGGTFNVLKYKQKKVNQIRLKLQEVKFGYLIVNADTNTTPYAWDYPVASDIVMRALFEDHSIADFMYFKSGEQYYTISKYWMPDEGFKDLQLSIYEDDEYVYELIFDKSV